MNYKINKILCFLFGHKTKYSVFNRRYKKCTVCNTRWAKSRKKWVKLKNE